MDAPFNMSMHINMKHSTLHVINDHFKGECTQLCPSYAIPATGNLSCAPTSEWALASSARSNNVPEVFIKLGMSGCMNLFLRSDKVEPQMGRPDNYFVGQRLVYNE